MITLYSLLEVFFAAIFFLDPTSFNLTLVVFIGTGMILFGLLNVIIGVHLKRALKKVKVGATISSNNSETEV